MISGIVSFLSLTPPREEARDRPFSIREAIPKMALVTPGTIARIPAARNASAPIANSDSGRRKTAHTRGTTHEAEHSQSGSRRAERRRRFQFCIERLQSLRRLFLQLSQLCHCCG